MVTHKITDVTVLRTEEEFINAAIQLLEQASRYVRIRSYALDPNLFDTREFNDALSAFARKSRFSEVQILIDNPDRLLKQGHRSIELMRRLSQKIYIREYFDEPDDSRESYMISDKQGVLIKYPSMDTDGYFSLTDKIYTSTLFEKFDYEWQRSLPARQLRTIHI